uniref:Protein NPAT C-terminal domain-containing protein n=1 Tax=Scophthalmus maximus TaxID=52904 RepID=A0A8D3D409_SCOMX
MLLPSDFARLVLGYLQEEGLSATSQAFIHESPNLKEYAEHTTADGTIPACVFSVFGKSLTTILNEYVAAKAKESCHEVPNRLNPGPMSPGRRKWDTPRKRGGALSGSSGLSRSAAATISNLNAEPQPEEAADHLVIQNARDRILGDRSLQEKLAENINKILPVPQTSKASAATVEPDQSIDEILGLQGEIHMSDDAIHDILEQTESDPAFQALFDLFDNTNVSDTNSVKSTAVQERKTRKAAAPTLLKKTLLAPSGRASRIEGSSATLLVSHRDHRRVSSAATGSNRRERASLFNSSVVVTPMDVDEPLNTPPPPSDTNMDSTATGLCEPTTVPSTSASLSLSSHPAFLVTVTAVPISPSDSIVAPFTATPDSPMCASASATLTATPASSTPDSPVSFSSSSCAPIAAAPDTSSSAAPSKATASSDNIVALKIIISDNQEEEDAPSDAALNQAITSISGDKIPTIYLSSPAKSPGFIPGIPGTPKTTLDEVALAVSGLQSSEARGSPVAAGKAFVASPLTGTSQAQQSYVIQLPMDATNAALQGTTAGYFLVTEPPTTDLQTRQVLLPAGLSKGRPFATTQFGATTPTLSQGYSAGKRGWTTTVGSALILPSPVKPLVLPISVLGQNTLGNVQMVIQPLTAENTSQQDAARRILRFDSSAEVQPQTSETAQTASPAATSQSSAQRPRKVKRRRSLERGLSKSADGTHNRDSDEAKASDCLSSRLSSSDSTTRSVTRKEKEESGRKEAAAEKPPAKSREGRSDRRTPSSSETPHVTANKENEIKGSAQEQHPPSTPTSSVSRDFSPPAVTLPIPNPESKATKTLSKTSSLAKQAAEMLQDIHGLHSPSSTPVKRPGESAADCPRTPSRQKKGKDGEGTPRRPMPPNTPEVPTCSPASEAGSENSINMAAHTLMILSRAAIARTGTPLKDSLRQEGAGDKSPTSSKNSKKRKQPSPAESPSAKKETKRSSSKTRDRKKKLVDCFPHDLDVDKFLSSLHYDE